MYGFVLIVKKKEKSIKVNCLEIPKFVYLTGIAQRVRFHARVWRNVRTGIQKEIFAFFAALREITHSFKQSQ